MNSASSCTRFDKLPATTAEGSRGPGSKRLSLSVAALPSVARRGSFGALSKHTTVDNGALGRSGSKQKALPLNQVQDLSADVLKAAGGSLCYACGTPTLESGKGLRQCIACGSVQLKSGATSHAYAKANMDEVLPNGTTSRQASKQSLADILMAECASAGEGGSMNPMANRNAWRRLSAVAPLQKPEDKGPENVLAEDERKPVMAGFVNTGYCVGDRVKTALRLPGAVPAGNGWDPINSQTDAGIVVGAGNNAGEVMVKFDHSGHTVSMKMGHIQHVKAQAPLSNVQRAVRRKPSSILAQRQTIS